MVLTLGGICLSRADDPNPEVEDLAKLCEALNREGTKYLLIGGFAVILHGYVRGTKDVDLLIDASRENVTLVRQDMTAGTISLSISRSGFRRL